MQASREPSSSTTTTADAEQVQDSSNISGTLHLQGDSSTKKKVKWQSKVVDNEHMNKKSSKGISLLLFSKLNL